MEIELHNKMKVYDRLLAAAAPLVTVEDLRLLVAGAGIDIYPLVPHLCVCVCVFALS